MQQNLILAGVGGQGILTIAQAISNAALKRGMHVKQAEVHGMSQRGGAVQSHLRLADAPIHSDVIPAGQVDLLIAVEPLEVLRYVQFLGQGGGIVCSINAFVNIGNYPPVESLLEQIARQPRHLLIDAERIARAAGSGRAANIAVLGAASLYLEVEPGELEDAVAAMFARKGAEVVEANRRAFRFGRNAAQAYVDGLERGGTSAAVRHWVETLGPEHLAEPERPDLPAFDPRVAEDALSGAEAHAVERTLDGVAAEGRRQLFEHEVYTIVQLVGAITPPHHLFLSTEDLVSAETLEQFPGDHVVLKIVSPDILHKTEARGISFVRKEHDLVRAEIDQLIARHREQADVRGVLLVEHVERIRPGFGNELFVGIRATRDFGPVIAAGLGGIDTEFLADKMLPGIAVAKAPAMDIDPEAFLALFRRTAAFDILAGRARGHRRIVSDGELLRCFHAFLHLAQRFCVDRGSDGPDVGELEVNPFAFRQQRLIPLDGRGFLATAAKALPRRPVDKVARLLEPRSMAVLGVSSNAVNVGRTILRNTIDSGYAPGALRVVKADAQEIDGVRCVPSVQQLPPTDLLVIAAPATELPGIVGEVVRCGKVEAAVMIPSGAGETAGSAELAAAVREAIVAGRQQPGGGPVFLGPNSLGAISRPGRYDTFFLPPEKMDKRRGAQPRPVALVSQSGAFIVSRLSNLETLDPAFSIAVGNQIDLTAADLLVALGGREDVQVVGIYAEGFNDLDGLALLRAVARVTAQNKQVVFYKAGRTEEGRSAAAGHTGSVAGDYDICQAAASQAGALVADTFKEFEQLVELCTRLHGKEVRGVRVAAVSNAGFEAVGIADAIQGQRYEVAIAELPEEARARLAAVLAQRGLAGLVDVRNPLDLTPMAGEQAYEDAIDVLLGCDDVDALIVGIVPLTSAIKTTAQEIEDPASLAHRLPRILAAASKPLVAVLDSGSPFDPFARALRLGGVPVFRSADQAIRSLGRYLCHRAGGPLVRQRRPPRAS